MPRTGCLNETPIGPGHQNRIPSLQPTPRQLPPELWLSIFPLLSDKDLRAVTRTCSAFRILAQPFLFRVLDVCPFFLAYNTDRPIYRPRRYLQSTLERLEFYKLPHIAPAVTQLWLSPYARSGFPPRRLTDDLDPALIISAIIDALPAFPNIRVLTWHCIDIRPSWWTALQRLPNLTSLWINSCGILPPAPGEFVPTFSLERITNLDLDQWAWEGQITNHVSIHEERLKGVDPVLLSMTIFSESIRSVSVPRHATAIHLLSTLVQLPHDAPCMLSSLTIPYSCTSSDDFIPALIQSTALKELHILPPQDELFHDPDIEGRLPDNCIRNLEVYEGPYHLLSIFANAHHLRPRKLRSVELWGLDEQVAMTVCDPHRVEDILEDLTYCDAARDALESFKILVTHITHDLIVLLSRFPHLKDLAIESQDSLIPSRATPQSTMELSPESPISVLYVLLRSHAFPPSLKHLTLTTHLKNTSNLDSMTQHIDAATFLESLGQVNQELESIDLKYGTYWTGIVDISWRRNALVSCHDSGIAGSHPDWDVDDAFRKASSLARSNTISSLASIASDGSQTTVEKFFALPSRPCFTTAINLRFGRMTFTEQKRAVVLPERTLPQERKRVGTSGLGWLGGGVNRVWHLVGRVGKIISGSVGFMRN